MRTEFRLLGDVAVRVGGHSVEVGHPRQRCVLVALLVDANRPIPVEQLLDRAWAGRPPQRARNALSGYVSRLRQVLAVSGDATVVRRSDCYLMTVDPNLVDLHRFRRLSVQARATGAGDDALAMVEQALALWRGPAFGTLDTPWLNDLRAGLEAQRLAVELDRNDLSLARGRHAALVDELSERAVAHPLDERLAGQLILALYRCGRQAEALRQYERLRRTLADELGVNPAPPLQRLYQQILTADPALAQPASARTRSPVPRQLPSPPSSFTGRTRELAALDAAGAAARTPADQPVAAVFVVSGTAGVGKTALALHWAHRAAVSFPDGQLYVHLRGFAHDGVLTPAEGLQAFLYALGVSPPSIPASVDAQAALYRSLMAGRRMLVVLDDAHDADQVRPLLPGTPGCLVLVTSRNQLTSLAATEGAQSLALDLFTPDEARDLLTRRLGPRRMDAEPAAVDQLIARCARLPLALAIVAARAAARPEFPLAAIADDLRRSLDAFSAEGLTSDVRAVFATSYRVLSTGAARLFRLLGLHPGPDIGLPAAASLAGVALPRIRPAMAELARAHLVIEHAPGRYTCHDLLRAYAVELARATDADAERRAATHRVLDHYLHSANAADERWDMSRHPITLAPPVPDVTPEHLADHDQALAWFTAERTVLLATVRLAASAGFDPHVWQLAWTLVDFFDRRGHWHDAADVLDAGLAAARRRTDQRAEAYVHRGLGRAHTRLGRYDRALVHLRHALDLFGQLGDHIGQAHSHLNLAWMSGQRGRHRDALDYARRALDLYRAAGHWVGQARILNSIGWYLAQLSEYQPALAYCQRALALLQEVGDRRGEANARDSLGYIYHHLGRHEQATAWYSTAVDLFRRSGDRYYEADSLTHLGDARHAAGDHDRAGKAWQAALGILDQLGHADAERVRAKIKASLIPL